ncbi:putative heme utilization/adhesion exoprotein, partial [Trabulsiella guamensis ATCC 49490]
QGAAGGDMNAAIAGAAAPYIAEMIGHQSGLEGMSKVAAHAVANAVLASMQGQNALAGAAGAATGELVGMIALEMYNKPLSELSETEKQTISALATIASGIAGGLAGDSSSSALAGAQSGKTTVENNLLGGSEWLQTEKAKEHGADVLSCSDNPSGEACKRGLAENKAYAAALATGSVALLPGSAQAMWLLGAGTNAGMQYADSSEINPVNSVAAGWINVITMGQSWKGTIAWNAAGGALTNTINGDDPLTGAITNGAGAWFGYGVGNYVVKPAANTIGKWITGGWNPKFDPTLLKYTEVKGPLGLSKEMVPSKIPSAVGNAGGSLSSEFGSSIIQKKKDAMEAGK